MRGAIDFSSWQGLVSTLLGLILVTVVAVGIRLLVMQRIQQRRERQNRQINERLKTLIAAYKTLGGSFTGDLAVDPSHRRDGPQGSGDGGDAAAPRPGAERRRRIRDAVEAALSDVLLLGTAEQVRLAAQAAAEMAAGRTIETAALVLSLRDFIREVLDLDPVPPELAIPKQGPLRNPAAGGRGGNAGGGAGGRGGGSGGGGAGQGGAGIAAGGMLGLGAGHGLHGTDTPPAPDPREP
ncbi:MAG: hypothetical protein QM750_06070 [Rubrivivax sp.]